MIVYKVVDVSAYPDLFVSSWMGAPHARIGYVVGEKIEREWGPMFCFTERGLYMYMNGRSTPSYRAVLECEIGDLFPLPQLSDGVVVAALGYGANNTWYQRAFWDTVVPWIRQNPRDVTDTRGSLRVSVPDSRFVGGHIRYDLQPVFQGTVASLTCTPLRVIDWYEFMEEHENA